MALSLVQWDNSPRGTDNFQIVSKLFDFGDASIDKKISKITVAFTKDGTTFTGLGLSYRTKGSGSYTLLGVVGGELGNATQVLTPDTPISCKVFQLKLSGSIVDDPGNALGINDISITYRPLRKYSVQIETTS